MSMQDSTAQLLARVSDLCDRARAGELTHTAFLTPGEQKRIAPSLQHIPHLLAGGYAAAERKRLFLLPPWMAELEGEVRADCLADATADTLLALEVSGGGFCTLAHKDYLGAVLNLGIERDAIGDLCVLDPHRALLFCDGVIAQFLTEHLTRVAGDAVCVRPCTVPPDFDGGRKFLRVTDTVASPRADSIVAALANLSRERASALFSQGLVEIDYETADKPAKQLAPGAVIVIRGKGKFILRAVSDQTKKGRYRLEADKYL
jgi:RNA-binding protein YlmH